MRIRKQIIVLLILGTTYLFANDLNVISTLVNKINKTNDAVIKNNLMKKLALELLIIDEKDFPKAKKIVNENLESENLEFKI